MLRLLDKLPSKLYFKTLATRRKIMKKILSFSIAILAAAITALAQETRSGQTVALKIPKCATPARKVMIGTVSCRAAACNAPDPSKLTGLAAMVALAQAQEGGGGAGGGATWALRILSTPTS